MNQVAINELVALDLKILNQIFIEDAILDWDLRGEGCFGAFLLEYLIQRWYDMIRSN